GDGGGQVGDDVTEEVVGDDDVEAGRVGDEEDHGGVDVQVVDRDIGELGSHVLHGAAPEVTGVHEDVVLVDEGELLARPGRGTGEGVTHDTLDTEGGVHAHLVGDLLRCAHTDGAAVADVRPLGALPDDDEVELARVGERGGHAGVDPGGPEVDVVVELEAQPQQQAPLEDAAGHGRVAHGAEEDGLVPADRGEVLVGEGL